MVGRFGGWEVVEDWKVGRLEGGVFLLKVKCDYFWTYDKFPSELRSLPVKTVPSGRSTLAQPDNDGEDDGFDDDQEYGQGHCRELFDDNDGDDDTNDGFDDEN